MPATGHKLEDVRPLADRRSLRTRQAIDRAFLGELERRGYDAVNVSDIAREADVGRATFYEHYKSKDDLLRAQLHRLLASTLRAGAGDAGAIDATALFAHIRDVPMLYRLIAGRSATARSVRVMSEALEARALALLNDRKNDRMKECMNERRLASPSDDGRASSCASVPVPAAARVLAATMCALLSWWSEQGLAATVDEMQAMFAACASSVTAPDDSTGSWR